MLHQKQKTQKLAEQFEGSQEENEFAKIRKLLREEKLLVEKRGLIEKALEKNATDLELRKQLKANDKEKTQIKDILINELKGNFKHIAGMWPKTANFKSEEQRMASWQTSSVIKQKIFRPAKQLLICDQGAEKLEEEKLKYDDFLSNFRGTPPRKSPLRMSQTVNVRGSMNGSSLEEQSCATPIIGRGSTKSNMMSAASLFKPDKAGNSRLQFTRNQSVESKQSSFAPKLNI